MLTVELEPPFITMARNLNLMLLRNTDPSGVPYGATGDKATITIDTSTAPGLASGNTITVTFTSFPGESPVTVVFTASASTGENYLPIHGGSITPAEVAGLATKIGAHSAIAPFFYVGISSLGDVYVIELYARDAVERWDPEFAVSGPAGWATGQSVGQPDNTPDNHRVIVEVMWEDGYESGGFVRVASLQPAQNQGVIWIDLEDILTAQWQASQASPPIPLDTANAARADNVRRYYVRYTEASGNPLTYGEYAATGVKLCMWGGVGKRLWSQGNYLESISDLNSLLHWIPSGKSVSPKQPEWLAWYNYTGATQTLRLKLVKTDDTNTDAAPVYLAPVSPLTVKAGETALFPVGIEALMLDPETVRKYTVRVQRNSGEDLSPPRAYHVDTLYYEDLRILQYINGFGIPETLRCSGRVLQTLNIDRSETRLALSSFYAGTDSERYQWDFEGEPIFTFRSGYLQKQAVHALQELFLYNEVWELLSPGKWRAMAVLARSMRVTETGQQLHFVEFQATPRMGMGNYDNTIQGGDGDWNTLPVEAEMAGISYWEINDDFIVQ